MNAEWINVKDRLPNCNGCYIVFIPHYYDEDHGVVKVCYFDGTDTWHNDDKVNFEEVLSQNDVTHWMPFPEPPMGFHRYMSKREIDNMITLLVRKMNTKEEFKNEESNSN